MSDTEVERGPSSVPLSRADRKQSVKYTSLGRRNNQQLVAVIAAELYCKSIARI